MPVKAYRVIDVVYDHQESFNLSETGVSRENGESSVISMRILSYWKEIRNETE